MRRFMILALTSDTVDRGRDVRRRRPAFCSRSSQVEGVGQVKVGGGSLPAVRVELNPDGANKYGIGLEDVRTAC